MLCDLKRDSHHENQVKFKKKYLFTLEKYTHILETDPSLVSFDPPRRADVSLNKVATCMFKK